MGPRQLLRRRVERLRRSLQEQDLEGVILAPGPNIRYYTGVESHLLERPFLLFVPVEGAPQLVAPRLESGPYARSPLGMEVHSWDDASGPSQAFRALRGRVDLKGRWGCEGRVPFGYLKQVIARGLQLELADTVLWGVREIKDDSELESLRRAADILGRAFLEVPKIARVGMTELELAKAFREEVFERGGETVDFCDVQAGRNAADPHWAPSAAKLRDGEGFLIDAGCTIAGYSADITRTFALGRNAEVEDAYATVLEGQEAGVAAVGAGVTTGEVDSATRSRLEAAGRGEQFFHRTGHGLGLEIHEAPYIVSGGTEELRDGMVFTVEPGAYVGGKYGVRIEDDVIVRGKGAEVISRKVPKDFGWWR